MNSQFVMATLLGSVVLLSACSAGRENSIQPRRVALGLEKYGALKPVVLPRSIDPTGTVHGLPAGARVFVERYSLVSYETEVGGHAMQESVPVFNVVSAVHRADGLILNTGTRVLKFPANAEISPSSVHALGFFAASQPLPSYLIGRKPDYVVP